MQRPEQRQSADTTRRLWKRLEVYRKSARKPFMRYVQVLYV